MSLSNPTIQKIQKSMLAKPLVIAGPCSAENREQMLSTARAIQHLPVSFFRAGIWKPRTSPGAFEGAGLPGLEWLQEVKRETGLKVCTEVANVHHVYAALKAGIDLLWIGARTTTSPFMVQEIAEALRGVHVPVAVKNPMNPDVKLWAGAFERLERCGVDNLIAIHRGFSVYGRKPYRNEPMWQIAVDLQNRFPEMPMICDPSHITGERKWVSDISQQAMDLNFDGLMIETHINPDEALTDAKQQILPETLESLLNNLEIPEDEMPQAPMDELKALRNEISELDRDLIQLLAHRMEVSGKIGRYKKKNGMMVLQNQRWQEVLKSNNDQARDAAISEEFVTDLFKLIHQESIMVQQEILGHKGRL